MQICLKLVAFALVQHVTQAATQSTSTPNSNQLTTSSAVIYNQTHHCTTTVLNQQWFLTTARCARMFKVNASVRISRIMSRGPADNTVLRFVPHPKYNPTSISHDIALVQVRKQILGAQPVALHTGASPQPGKWSMTVGYPETQSDSPATFAQVGIPIKSVQDCANFLPRTSCDDESSDENPKFLCAGYTRTENCARCACHTDPGDPLFISTSFSENALIGFNVRAQKCGPHRHPGVYTAVSPYVDWIVSSITGRVKLVNAFEQPNLSMVNRLSEPPFTHTPASKYKVPFYPEPSQEPLTYAPSHSSKKPKRQRRCFTPTHRAHPKPHLSKPESGGLPNQSAHRPHASKGQIGVGAGDRESIVDGSGSSPIQADYSNEEDAEPVPSPNVVPGELVDTSKNATGLGDDTKNADAVRGANKALVISAITAAAVLGVIVLGVSLFVSVRVASASNSPPPGPESQNQSRDNPGQPPDSPTNDVEAPKPVAAYTTIHESADPPPNPSWYRVSVTDFEQTNLQPPDRAGDQLLDSDFDSSFRSTRPERYPIEMFC